MVKSDHKMANAMGNDLETGDPVQQALDEAIRRCERMKLGLTVIPCSLPAGDPLWSDHYRTGRDAGVSICVRELAVMRRELAGK